MSEVTEIGWELTQSGVLYRVPLELGVEDDGPFPLRDERPDSLGLDVRRLEDLWVDGRLKEHGDAFLLPWEDVYDLDVVEAEGLMLPTGPEDELDIRVRVLGGIRSEEFRVRARVRHPQFGILPEGSRSGPAFQVDDLIVLAPRDALALFGALDRPIGSGLEERLRIVGEVRKAASRCGANLDPFLTNEEILVPDSIGLEAEVISPDEVRIRPVLEGEGMERFSSFPGPGTKTKAAYTVVEGAKRTRVALSAEQREAADQVLQREAIRGPDVPRFFTNPEAFVPELIDLGRFSKRVRGLIPRKYTSQPYLRADPGGKDWFSVSAEVELSADELITDFPPTPGVEESDELERRDVSAAQGETPTDGDAPSISPSEYAELCEEVLRTGERFIRKEDAWVEIEPEKAEEYLKTWKSLEHKDDGQLTLALDKAGYVLDVVSNLEQLLYSETREDQDGLAFLEEIPEYPVPSEFKATLMPHQHVGYNWMRFLQEQGLGGLLADDMGLGKTVQVISFMAFLADRDQLAPTLIVLPSALIENWHSEIRRFCPAIDRVYHHLGSDREKDPELIAQSQIVLTTYQTLRRDQLHMGQVDWKIVISDEAQYVKNPTAQSTAVLKAMKAEMRIALTGTPVENGLSELWCIVDFVQPGRLGSQKEFRTEFERPITRADDEEARWRVARELQERLTPHYVRRVKENILDSLPPKEEVTSRVPLSSRQRSYYGEVIHQLRQGETIAIAALQYLIEISSHPELYRPSSASLEELLEDCPKLQETMKILEQVKAKDEKALIYTHYRKMQAILQDLCQDRFHKHVPIINARVAGNRRLGVVDQFNNREGFAAMILAPQAAGVGLNITGANHVIHYTRLWNPAKENQATDRAHRFGQERPVTVYYPLVEGNGFTSVEERLDELLEEKRELARNVLWPRSALSVSSELQSFLGERELG